MENKDEDKSKEEQEAARLKAKQEKAQEEERLGLLMQADEVKGKQLVIGIDGSVNTEDELRQSALGGDTQDPQKMHEVYYKGIQKLLTENLPTGKTYEKARNYVYEEKNTYLSGGHRLKKDGTRGADGRMGYKEAAEEMFELVMDWVLKKGSAVDIYITLRDLNVKSGYGMPDTEKGGVVF